MKTISFAVLGVCCGLAACSPSARNKVYTENDVRQFVQPGTSREAIIGRFGSPVYVENNPKFEDGSTNIDEILIFSMPGPRQATNESWVFSGFQVYLKEGKAIRWSAAHRDTHVGP